MVNNRATLHSELQDSIVNMLKYLDVHDSIIHWIVSEDELPKPPAYEVYPKYEHFAEVFKETGSIEECFSDYTEWIEATHDLRWALRKSRTQKRCDCCAVPAEPQPSESDG